MVIDKNLIVEKNGKFTFVLKRNYRAVFGFGEKFDSVNQKGKFVRSCVREKCFYQGEYTYYSMPFFFTPDNFGVFVNTYVEVDFDFTKSDEITITYEKGSKGEKAEIYLFEGNVKEIIKQFRNLVGFSKVFPKWVLGSWMSSNRWKTQEELEEQLEYTKKYKIPHNVMVVEPWSDLTTHYLWNGSHIKHKNGDEKVENYKELDFSNSKQWHNPKEMIDCLHENGLRLLLWVVPIYAQDENLETDCNVEQCLSDNEFVKQNKECVLNADGTPYEIPHTWCVKSMVPDFTDPIGCKRWFGRFEYLKQMGIDGFKTDGGEFIHYKEVKFADGSTGIEGINKYCEDYTSAFAQFIGENGIVFSRAGGPKSPTFSIMWAGDQESTWPEFRSMIKAGLSASLSGTNCWAFDISGFSGYLPSQELYLRSLQTAAFVPIMQWHSDPVTNNRCDFTRAWKINDRSPWNMAGYFKNENLIETYRKQFLLHYNLIPYQYYLMKEASKEGIGAMRHLVYEFFSDENVYDVDDEFMVGSALLIAPVLDDYITSRNVYLPNGNWFNFYTGEKLVGGKTYNVQLSSEYIPTYMRENTCIPLNLKDGKIYSDVGNDLSRYEQLTFLVSGEGRFDFCDDLNNKITIIWTKESEQIEINSNLKIYVKHIENCILL